MQANLTLIAERLRQKADALEDVPVVGGDYEQKEFNLMPTELSAATFLRERADSYEEAQRQMNDWKPYPLARVVLDPRPSKALYRIGITALIVGTLVLLYLLCGCSKSAQSTLKAAAPCAPNVTAQVRGSALMRAPVVDKRTDSRANWSDLHEARCPDNMRTVLSSTREYLAASDNGEAGDFSKWEAEHTYCEPDGVHP